MTLEEIRSQLAGLEAMPDACPRCHANWRPKFQEVRKVRRALEATDRQRPPLPVEPGDDPRAAFGASPPPPAMPAAPPKLPSMAERLGARDDCALTTKIDAMTYAVAGMDYESFTPDQRAKIEREAREEAVKIQLARLKVAHAEKRDAARWTRHAIFTEELTKRAERTKDPKDIALAREMVGAVEAMKKTFGTR